MFRNFAFASLIGSVLFLVDTFAAEPVYRYTTINYPGAMYTVAWGINSRGDVVGRYGDFAGMTHGFLMPHKGEPVSIDVPDWLAGGTVVYTEARGISPGGDIVGYYYMAGEDPNIAGHGYLRRRDGSIVRVHKPDHLNEYLQRILPDGSILGCYHDHDTMMSMHGVVFSRRVWTGLPAAMSMTNGATPDLSQQTGFAYDMTATPPRSRGFLLGACPSIENSAPTSTMGCGRNSLRAQPTEYSDRLLEGEVYTLFDYPGASATFVWDMNPSGAIVGRYNDSNGGGHGFLLEDGVFTTIQVTGSTLTAANGINPRGDIVGSYKDASNGGRFQGFLAERTRGRD